MLGLLIVREGAGQVGGRWAGGGVVVVVQVGVGRGSLALGVGAGQPVLPLVVGWAVTMRRGMWPWGLKPPRTPVAG